MGTGQVSSLYRRRLCTAVKQWSPWCAVEKGTGSSSHHGFQPQHAAVLSEKGLMNPPSS